MQRFRNQAFSDIIAGVRDEYHMRGEELSPDPFYAVLKQAVQAIENGVLELPQRSIFFWADQTIDFCLKYIEMSGMVRLRSARSRLLKEQKRREAEHVCIQDRQGSVEIYNC